MANIELRKISFWAKYNQIRFNEQKSNQCYERERNAETEAGNIFELKAPRASKQFEISWNNAWQ